MLVDNSPIKSKQASISFFINQENSLGYIWAYRKCFKSVFAVIRLHIN